MPTQNSAILVLSAADSILFIFPDARTEYLKLVKTPINLLKLIEIGRSSKVGRLRDWYRV